jgi:hypothetical protein
MLVRERFADPIVSLPPDAFRKREPVQLRSVITGKIGSPVTIRQPQDRKGLPEDFRATLTGDLQPTTVGWLTDQKADKETGDQEAELSACHNAIYI